MVYVSRSFKQAKLERVPTKGHLCSNLPGTAKYRTDGGGPMPEPESLLQLLAGGGPLPALKQESAKPQTITPQPCNLLHVKSYPRKPAASLLKLICKFPQTSIHIYHPPRAL